MLALYAFPKLKYHFCIMHEKISKKPTAMFAFIKEIHQI